METTLKDAVQSEKVYFKALVALSRELASHDVRSYPAVLEMIRQRLNATDAALVIGVLSEREGHLVTGNMPLVEAMTAHGEMAVSDSEQTDIPGNPRAAYFYSLGKYYGMFGMVFKEPRKLTANEKAFMEGVIEVLTIHARGKHHIRTLNNFNRMINHDLRTPLTVSLSAMSVLDEMNAEFAGKQKDMMERIRGNLNYTSEILDKAADSAKIDPETGYYNISREVVDVIELVKELVEGQKIRAQRSQITLTSEIDDTAPVLSLDKIMIQRAFMNLIDNAIKYTKEGGTVHISLQTEDRRLIFKVKDTGIGIPPEKLARLFERFYRVQQRGTERIKGTGLGLFIVKHIAQRHGGDVTVETEAGKGSTFTLWLPMEGANIPGAVT